MSVTSKTVIGLASIVLIASLSGWMLITGLSRGVVYSQRVAYSRTDDPSNYWFYTIAYAVMFLSTGGLLAYLAIDILLRS